MASSTTRSTGTGTTTSSTSTTTGRTMPITTSVRRLVVSRYVFPYRRISSGKIPGAYAYLTDFNQPPSIRPTSKACSVSFRYFLLSKIFISLASRNRSFNTPSLGYLIRRRTKPLTDCKTKFKKLNGFASLQFTIADPKSWPTKIAGIKLPKQEPKR